MLTRLRVLRRQGFKWRGLKAVGACAPKNLKTLKTQGPGGQVVETAPFKTESPGVVQAG
jgi:hypothetical protein